jgi:protein-disulfide isomerase
MSFQTPQPIRAPSGTTQQGDGIAIGNGPVAVDAYIDFQCPFCKAFEDESSEALADMVVAGAITMIYHPLRFLDRLSTTAYSSRAASASGCAADRGRFWEYKDSLFANQPPEGGPGLSDDELIALGQGIGIGDESFGECVRAHVYVPWVSYVTEIAIERGVSGTPTVLVEGVQVDADPRTIASAVAAIVRAP